MLMMLGWSFVVVTDAVAVVVVVVVKFDVRWCAGDIDESIYVLLFLLLDENHAEHIHSF